MSQIKRLAFNPTSWIKLTSFFHVIVSSKEQRSGKSWVLIYVIQYKNCKKEIAYKNIFYFPQILLRFINVKWWLKFAICILSWIILLFFFCFQNKLYWNCVRFSQNENIWNVMENLLRKYIMPMQIFGLINSIRNKCHVKASLQV